MVTLAIVLAKRAIVGIVWPLVAAGPAFGNFASCGTHARGVAAGLAVALSAAFVGIRSYAEPEVMRE